MTSEQENKLDSEIRKALTKVYNRGMVAGARGISQGILYILNNDLKSASVDEKLDRIIQFCEVGAGQEKNENN